MKTFSKIEFFAAVTVGVLGGMAVGYSKAREKCLEALIKASSSKNNNDSKETEEES